jgi:hypothetical protein
MVSAIALDNAYATYQVPGKVRRATVVPRLAVVDMVYVKVINAYVPGISLVKTVTAARNTIGGLNASSSVILQPRVMAMASVWCIIVV